MAEMLTVKEFAVLRGRSVQSVYKQMKRKYNKEALEGHTFYKKVNNKPTLFLDEEAVRVLDEASRQAPSIVLKEENKDEIKRLEAENKAMLLKVTELQEALIKSGAEVRQLAAEKAAMLEDKNGMTEKIAGVEAELERLKARNWWQRLLNV